MDDSNPELESFRQQWRAEVSARSQADRPKTTKPVRKPPPISSLSSTTTTKTLKPLKEEEEAEEPGRTFGDAPVRDELPESFKGKEPQSALEHYEKAVEREDQGSLGDSLSLYRKAFRVRRRAIIRFDLY